MFSIKNSEWLSVCCACPPMDNSEAATDDPKEIIGICACCKDWTTFYQDETGLYEGVA